MGKHMAAGQVGAGGRGRYHHGDLRRDLLQVARGQIADHGAGTLSLAALARLAGVSQAAPYRHFADRNALLEAVAADGFQVLVERLAAALDARQPPQGATAALATAYLQFGEENAELYRLMFASGLVPAATVDGPLAAKADEAFAMLRSTLASREPDGPEVEQAAYRVWAQLHGLVMLKADGFIKSPLNTLLD